MKDYDILLSSAYRARMQCMGIMLTNAGFKGTPLQSIARNITCGLASQPWPGTNTLRGIRV